MRRSIAVVNICRDVRKQLAADLIRLAVKNDEVDGHIVRKQEIADSVDRRPERQILRKSVDTGGDERKRDRRTAVLQRERKRRPVAGSEQLSLSVRAAAPARPDRVDDVPARQRIALRELRVPSRAAAERFALCQQLRTGGAVDAAVHPTAAVRERGVCGVDDGIDLHMCNVVSDDLQRHGMSPFRSKRHRRAGKQNDDHNGERERRDADQHGCFLPQSFLRCPRDQRGGGHADRRCRERNAQQRP